MTVLCSININSDGSYYGDFVDGDTVSGCFDLDVSESIHVSSIDVSLVTVHTVNYLNYGEPRRKHHESMLASQEIYQRVGHGNGMIRSFHTGLYRYNFSLQLPIKCSVPTFNILTGITDFNYYVRVTIRGPSFANGNFAHKHPFQVVPISTFKMGDQQLVISQQTAEFVIRRLIQIEDDFYCLNEHSDLEIYLLLDPLALSLYYQPETLFTWNLIGHLDLNIHCKAFLDRSKVVTGRPLPLSLYFGSQADTLQTSKYNKVFLQYVKAHFVVHTNLKVDTAVGTTELLSTCHPMEVFRSSPQNIQLLLTSDYSGTFGTGMSKRFPLGCCISPEFFGSSKVLNYMAPTFHSDRLAVNYDLHVTVGLSAREVTTILEPEVDPEIDIVTMVFEDVCIQSDL